MSGNAALAAAKRRRNPVEQQSISSRDPQMSMMDDEEPLLTKTMTERGVNGQGLKVNKTSQIKDVNQLIFEHDKLLFILERRLDMIDDNGGSSTSGNSDELENYTRNTNSELKLLKTALAKQQKSMQELTTVVTSLRGTISNQNVTIADLTEQLNNATLNQSHEVKLEKQDEPDVKGQTTMKLNISETE
jgi:hypothetical protein